MRFLPLLLVLATPLFANSYSTNFPAGEMNNWVQGKTNGLDWSNVVNVPGLAYGTQPGTGQYDDSTAIVPGNWGNDQTAQATVSVPGPTGSVAEVELRLRTSISAHAITGYEFNASVSAAGGAYMQIVRWNGPSGSFTYLGEAAVLAHSGDTLMATAKGNILTWYKNGVAVCSASDGTFPSGAPGIGMYSNTGTSENGYGLSSFSATDNGSTAPLPTPTPAPAPTPVPYGVWEQGLVNELESLRVSTRTIQSVQGWLSAHPPTP